MGWAKKEFETIDLGDRRLNQRCVSQVRPSPRRQRGVRTTSSGAAPPVACALPPDWPRTGGRKRCTALAVVVLGHSQGGVEASPWTLPAAGGGWRGTRLAYVSVAAILKPPAPHVRQPTGSKVAANA